MFFKRYENFLGIKKLNPEARHFITTSMNIDFVFTALVFLTSSFFILYALRFLSLLELSILITAQVLVQFLTDYPTGVIGDWIGQRWLLALSAIFYSLAYVIFSLSTEFLTFLLAIIFIALAESQESGAFDSWFQNNYKMYAPEDSSRQIYTELISKQNVIYFVIMALTFSVSGFVVLGLGSNCKIDTFCDQGTQRLLYLQGFLFALMPILILKYIKNHPNFKKEELQLNFATYKNLLKEGFNAIKENQVLRLFIAGTAIFAAVITVWVTLILFRVYGEYSGSTDRIGILRALVLLFSIFGLFLFGILSRKIRDLKRWMISLALLQSPAFFGLIYITLLVFPISNCRFYCGYSREFDWGVLLIVGLVIGFAGLAATFFRVLTSRFYLDIIPDKNRNSIYSLVPTLTAALKLVMLPIAGYILQNLLTFRINGVLIRIPEMHFLLVLMLIGFFGSLLIVKALMRYEPTEDDEPKRLELIHELSPSIFAELQLFIPLQLPTHSRLKESTKKAWDLLISAALTDGEISEEEHELLINITANLQEYTALLENAIEDDIITSEEKEWLIKAREKLWKEAYDVAIAKNGISHDEHNILQKLLEIIQAFEKEENL